MNHSREKGVNEKPVKKHREGYTGERKKKLKQKAIEALTNSLSSVSLQKTKSVEELDKIRKEILNTLRKSGEVNYVDSIYVCNKENIYEEK